MPKLGTFTITTGDDVHTVDWHSIDLVRYEMQFGKSSSALDGMLDQYRMAWLASRRAKLNGTPEVFEAWLDLTPDVGLSIEDDDAPKEATSDQEASSTSSPG